MDMKTVPLLFLIFFLALGFLNACKTGALVCEDQKGSKACTASEQDAVDENESKNTLKELERKLVVSRSELEKLKVEQMLQRKRNERAVKEAEAALDLKKKRFDNFVSEEVSLKIQASVNELDELKNELRSAEEELQQLEMMYAEDDLGDKTKEIVLDRSRRALVLKRDELKLKERKHTFLVDREIALETEELQAELEEATGKLDEAGGQVELEKMEMQIRLDQAEFELKSLQAKMDKLKREKAK